MEKVGKEDKSLVLGPQTADRRGGFVKEEFAAKHTERLRFLYCPLYQIPPEVGKYHPFTPNFPFLWQVLLHLALRAVSTRPLCNRLGVSVKVKNCILENGIFLYFPA